MTTTQDPWEDAQRQLERYVRERNEARAEVERLRAELAQINSELDDDAMRRLRGVPSGSVMSAGEARAALVRFCNSHFNNPGEHARFSIPANERYDDDMRLMAFIAEADVLRARVAELEAAKPSAGDEPLTSEQARELMREGEQVARDFKARMRGEWAGAAERVVAAARSERERLDEWAEAAERRAVEGRPGGLDPVQSTREERREQ